MSILFHGQFVFIVKTYFVMYSCRIAQQYIDHRRIAVSRYYRYGGPCIVSHGEVPCDFHIVLTRRSAWRICAWSPAPSPEARAQLSGGLQGRCRPRPPFSVRQNVVFQT